MRVKVPQATIGCTVVNSLPVEDRSMPFIDRCLAVSLALFFGFATVDKLVHLSEFVRAVDSYRFMYWTLGQYLAPVIIAAEFSVSVGLLFRSSVRFASGASAFLLLVFTVALIVNRFMGGDDRLCGCWFSISLGQGGSHLALNALLFAMSVLLFVGCGKPSNAAPRQGSVPDPAP
jgi:hypothetical protein